MRSGSFKRRRRRPARDKTYTLTGERRSQSLLKLLIDSIWFRLVFIGAVTGGLAVALILPKIWRTTPSGFLPEIRVSLLDKIQAQSLRKTAEAAAEEGSFNSAFSAWRAAWFNDVADLRSLRGLLASVPEYDEPERTVGLCVQAGEWLGRLGGTNIADIELTARAFMAAGISEEAARILDPLQADLPETLERTYLMALFDSGRTAQFSRRMAANPSVQPDIAAAIAEPDEEGAMEPADVRFRMYCLAYLAAWGPSDQQPLALEQLRRAQLDRRTENLAYNLEFILSLQLARTERCAAILEVLDAVGQATVQQHTGYWMALVNEGRKTEAKALATRANLVPRNVMDAYNLALALMALDLLDRADRLVELLATSTGITSRLMVLHSTILIKRRNWEALRKLALRMRVQPQTAQTLGAFGYYLEGVADWETGSPDPARRLFRKAADIGFDEPALAINVAEGLVNLDVSGAEIAHEILEAYHDRAGGGARYLELRLLCEDKLKQTDRLLETAKQLYEMDPTSVKNINNYAAVLCTLRQEPQVAVRLTLEALQRQPNDGIMILNHAQALVQNSRYEESLEQLRRIIASLLDANMAAQYYLTLFEAQWKLGNRLEAEYALERIDPSYLFDVQREWLKEAQAEFAPP